MVRSEAQLDFIYSMSGISVMRVFIAFVGRVAELFTLAHHHSHNDRSPSSLELSSFVLDPFPQESAGVAQKSAPVCLCVWNSSAFVILAP